MPNVKPIKDQVLIRQEPRKERLKSGLYVPDTATRDLYDDVGTVVAVGPGRVTENGVLIRPDVKPGDRVVFIRKPGTALMPDSREGDEYKDLIMLREDDIVGVVEPWSDS